MAEDRMSEIQLGHPTDPLEIRKACRQDIPAILELYAAARKQMAAQGNEDQWTHGYPGLKEIEADMARDALFITEDKKAVMALIGGDDPTYAHIQGVWSCCRPYMTIHRIASSRKGHGWLLFAFAKTCTSHIRIDTHPDNAAMLHRLQKEGFVYDGIIQSVNGPRMAFTWTAKER